MIPLFNGRVKSIQTGYYYNSSALPGSGEETRYADLSVIEVNPDKCVILVTGGCGSSEGNAWSYSSGSVSARMLSYFQVRFMSGNAAAHLAVRYTVIEFY